MSDRLLDIFAQSGDANLGQTLLRLARLAAVAHGRQATRSLIDALPVEDQRGQGLGPGSVAYPHGKDAGAGSRHTEVPR